MCASEIGLPMSVCVGNRTPNECVRRPRLRDVEEATDGQRRRLLVRGGILRVEMPVKMQEKKSDDASTVR